MPAPMTQPDLVAGFQRLLPRGRVWPREADATQAALIDALMPGYARLVARDANLLIDAFPATTVELLPEWEASLGLPDPCVGPNPSIATRRAQVVARLSETGGQSIPFFTAYAARLGAAITVQEYAPARVGIAVVGDRLFDDAWAHAWQVTAPAVPYTPAVVGTAKVGDPLLVYGDAAVECELNRMAPAHTSLSFVFTGG